MSRVRYNNALGVINADLAAGATDILFQTAPAFESLASGDYVPLVLEPPLDGSPSANFEIVYLTAYTAGQTTGTILRAQEGTTAVEHLSGTRWACAVLASDPGLRGPTSGGGSGGAGSSWTGDYVPGASYNAGDIIIDASGDDGVYIALSDDPGNLIDIPDTSNFGGFLRYGSARATSGGVICGGPVAAGMLLLARVSWDLLT